MATPEPPVQESRIPYGRNIEGITPVHDELRVAHQRRYPSRVQPPYLLPLGDHHRGIGALQRLVGVEDGLNVGRELCCGLTRHRVKTYHPGPERGQCGGYRQARAPLRSSVFGLKERPSRATRLPLRECRSACSLWITLLRCLSFTAVAASRSGVSCSYSRAVARRAATSFGKQDPPQPSPAERKRGPTRSSRPTP